MISAMSDKTEFSDILLTGENIGPDSGECENEVVPHFV